MMLLCMISESFPQNIWIAYHNNNNNLQFFNMNVSVPYELSRFALSFKKLISLQILKNVLMRVIYQHPKVCKVCVSREVNEKFKTSRIVAFSCKVRLFVMFHLLCAKNMWAIKTTGKIWITLTKSLLQKIDLLSKFSPAFFNMLQKTAKSSTPSPFLNLAI